jgi:flagellar basal-body rod protein FlgC
VRIGGVTNDPMPGQQVYNPQHPDAGADGMVTMPNVNLAYEMVDLITASRAYEANLSVVKNARTMAIKTFEIGK